jgi:GntR family transcriptional regulator
LRYLVIDTRSAVPVYLQIVEQIRARVSDGSLAPGAPLPSVRQMATDLGINPNTVAKAYMLLERDSIVLTVRRRGTFIAEAARKRADASLDLRIDEAIDRILGEAPFHGMQRGRLLEALKRKLRKDEPKKGRSGGKSR